MKVFRAGAFMMAVAFIGLAGVATSQAQTNVAFAFNCALKGKLAPSGATVANADLSGNTNNLALMETSGGDLIIGEYAVSGVSTTVAAAYLKDTSQAITGRAKFALVLTGLGADSNAVLLADFGAASGGFKMKVSGVWIDGTNAVSATIDSIKAKK